MDPKTAISENSSKRTFQYPVEIHTINKDPCHLVVTASITVIHMNVESRTIS
jgi:hypothetical protein